MRLFLNWGIVLPFCVDSVMAMTTFGKSFILDWFHNWSHKSLRNIWQMDVFHLTFSSVASIVLALWSLKPVSVLQVITPLVCLLLTRSKVLQTGDGGSVLVMAPAAVVGHVARGAPRGVEVGAFNADFHVRVHSLPGNDEG